jgi:hypothetical protein
MSKEEQLLIASNIEKNYKCRIVKNEENPFVLFCAADIGEILNLQRITNFQNINLNDRILVKTDTNGGDQHMIYLTYNGLMKILSSSRKSNLIEFSEKIGIDVKTKIYSCIEADTIKCIIQSFSGEEMIEQYNVCGTKYRIDLYFPKYEIAVECDEHHHKTISNKLKDVERQLAIKDRIVDIIFIRYDPFDKDFKIFNIINEIYKEIISCKDSLLKSNMRELEEIRHNNVNYYEFETKQLNYQSEFLNLHKKELEIQELEIRCKMQQNLENTIKLNEEEPEEVNIPDDIYIKSRENTRSPKVYQYDPQTLELIKIYDSVITFTRHFHSSSGSALREAAKNNRIYKDYRWALSERNTVDIPIIEPTIESRTQSVEYIAMIDIKKTKILEVYPSQKEAAMSRNLAGFSTISRAIKKNGISSGHYWKVFDHCSEEMKNAYLMTNKLPEPHIKANGTSVIQINPINGQEIKVFKSITEVLKKFQMSRASLNKASDTDETHNGFKWKVNK